MTIILYTPAIVMVVGLIMFLAASNPPTPNSRVARIGEIMFFCGLLVTLFWCSGHKV